MAPRRGDRVQIITHAPRRGRELRPQKQDLKHVRAWAAREVDDLDARGGPRKFKSHSRSRAAELHGMEYQWAYKPPAFGPKWLKTMIPSGARQIGDDLDIGLRRILHFNARSWSRSVKIRENCSSFYRCKDILNAYRGIGT